MRAPGLNATSVVAGLLSAVLAVLAWKRLNNYLHTIDHEFRSPFSGEWQWHAIESTWLLTSWAVFPTVLSLFLLLFAVRHAIGVRLMKIATLLALLCSSLVALTEGYELYTGLFVIPYGDFENFPLFVTSVLLRLAWYLALTWFFWTLWQRLKPGPTSPARQERSS
jgi:hypothetical protein